MRVQDMPDGQMSVCFPDTMEEETRWQTAFYETDTSCDPNRLYSLDGGGHQGIWWEDEEGVPWYLMTEGISVIRPAPKPVRKSRTLRTATPGTTAVAALPAEEESVMVACRGVSALHLETA